jgi:hypothetical protein
VVGITGQDGGAAGAANTLLTPDGDGGKNIVNGLQNRTVSGHVDYMSARSSSTWNAEPLATVPVKRSLCRLRSPRTGRPEHDVG